MTATYTPPYRITPAILRVIEDSALASDQESDYQSDQVMRLVYARNQKYRLTALGMQRLNNREDV